MGSAAPGRETPGLVLYVEIDEAHRGQGLGREAMEAAEAWTLEHGGTRISLNVFGPNIVARSLYDSLGFQVHGDGDVQGPLAGDRAMAPRGGGRRQLTGRARRRGRRHQAPEDDAIASVAAARPTLTDRAAHPRPTASGSFAMGLGRGRGAACRDAQRGARIDAGL